jgi:hypothetical protein
MDVYEVRPRKDHRSVDLISDVLPFGRLWYGEPSAVTNAIGYAKFFSRSHHAVIRVYDEAARAEVRTEGTLSARIKCAPDRNLEEVWDQLCNRSINEVFR